MPPSQSSDAFAPLTDYERGVLRAISVLGMLDSWTGHHEPFTVRTTNGLLLTIDSSGALWAQEDA